MGVITFTANLPEQKSSLDGAVLKQFSEIQKSLMRLVDSQDASKQTMHKMMAENMQSQSSSLITAIDKMMGMMQKMFAGNTMDEKISDSIESLEETLTNLIKQVKKPASSSNGKPSVTVTPKVTVTIPAAITDRLDQMQSALLQGLRKSRSRTFGSNY